MRTRKKLMTLERLATVEDGYEDSEPDRWVTVQEVWVMLQNWNPRGSQAVIDALQVKEQNTHYGRLRHIDGVNSTMRLRHDDRVFSITSVQLVNEVNRFLDMRLIEVIDG